MNKLFVIAIIFCTSCTTIKPRDSKLTLSTIESLRIEQTNLDEIVTILGKPDRIFEYDGDIVWSFQEGPYSATRMTLAFDKQTKLLISKAWFVRGDEIEQNIEVIKKKYPANYVRMEREQVNPHALPDEVDFIDKDLGISIEFRKTRKEVSAISWYTTNLKFQKKPAAVKRKVKYQIGGIDT